jgi:hypothetical protein
MYQMQTEEDGEPERFPLLRKMRCLRLAYVELTFSRHWFQADILTSTRDYY